MTYCCAEIGINHNGSLDIAKKLIDECIDAGFDCVKFQKRTLDLVYTQAELGVFRQSPFGETNGDLKRALEFAREQYDEIDAHCKGRIEWTASVWDHESIAFLLKYDPPFIKIPSALLTHDVLLRHVRATGKPVVASTGMSSLDEIDHAVEVLGKHDLVLLHCTSTYPAADDELNLRCIPILKERYGVQVGYSGHERGIATTVAAVALGATFVERHVTLDRTMFGTDQAASLEVNGFHRLVRDIRTVEDAFGDGIKRVYDSEIPVRNKLRRH